MTTRPLSELRQRQMKWHSTCSGRTKRPRQSGAATWGDLGESFGDLSAGRERPSAKASFGLNAKEVARSIFCKIAQRTSLSTKHLAGVARKENNRVYMARAAKAIQWGQTVSRWNATHGCGSTEHLRADCDNSGPRSTNAHVAWTGYAQLAPPGIDDMQEGPLAGVFVEATRTERVMMINSAPSASSAQSEDEQPQQQYPLQPPQ